MLRSVMNIEQKLAQLYAGLREMRVTEKLASIKPKTKRVGNQFVTSIDFTDGTDPATAANRVSLLFNNIASLKDHLKAWCKRNGKPFTGDQLIDSNRDVAIIHNLWNLDKHASPTVRDQDSGLDLHNLHTQVLCSKVGLNQPRSRFLSSKAA